MLPRQDTGVGGGAQALAVRPLTTLPLGNGALLPKVRLLMTFHSFLAIEKAVAL